VLNSIKEVVGQPHDAGNILIAGCYLNQEESVSRVTIQLLQFVCVHTQRLNLKTLIKVEMQ